MEKVSKGKNRHVDLPSYYRFAHEYDGVRAGRCVSLVLSTPRGSSVVGLLP